MDRAVEIGFIKVSGQITRGAEQHGRMSVMPTGMHPARMLRGMGESVLFRYRQGIHIGPQTDGPCALPLA